MGRYNVHKQKLYCSLSLRVFTVVMLLWLFLAHPFFCGLAVALLSTYLTQADCFTCVCYGFKVIEGGVIFQRLWYVIITLCLDYW